MRNRAILLWTAHVLLLLLTGRAHAQATYGTNLVKNGGAEKGDSNGGSLGAPWSASGSISAFSYSSPPSGSGLKTGQLAAPPALPGDSGNTLFFAGGEDFDLADVDTTFAQQTIDLAALSSDIAGGKITFALSAYLGGLANVQEYAYVIAEFKKSDGTTLLRSQLNHDSPVFPGATALTKFNASGTVPAGAAQVVITVGMNRDPGANFNNNYLSGYADNLSLILTNPDGGNGGGGPNTFDPNKDSSNDLLWQNTTTGDVAVWYLNKTVYKGGAILASALPIAYKIVGVADFNGDKQPDILFQNTTTGDLDVWYMNGGVHTGNASLYKGLALAYAVVGTPDLNGDGKPDILFQNTTTGDLYYWLLNGVSIGQQALLATLSTTRYTVVATGDLDGDKNADILFRDTTTGDLDYWLLTKTAIKKTGLLASSVPLVWKVGALTDLDGDGKLDLVWRNTTSGDAYYWLLNGVTYRSNGLILGGTPAAWTLVGPH